MMHMVHRFSIRVVRVAKYVLVYFFRVLRYHPQDDGTAVRGAAAELKPIL